MKLLFTKLQEEITTVRKSVTQFRVETGKTDVKAAEFPVIELKPESQRIEYVEDNTRAPASYNDRRVPLALAGKAGQVSDVVDLRGVSKKSALSPVTYSAHGALKATPCRESLDTDSVSKAENDGETFSVLDEKRARHQFTTRKFIATQEMIEYHTAQEKHVSFELTI
jgi:hypothetical protein